MTLALYVCVGADEVPCGRIYAAQLWPWAGAAVVRTHGICPACASAAKRQLRALRVPGAACAPAARARSRSG